MPSADTSRITHRNSALLKISLAVRISRVKRGVARCSSSTSTVCRGCNNPAPRLPVRNPLPPLRKFDHSSWLVDNRTKATIPL